MERDRLAGGGHGAFRRLSLMGLGWDMFRFGYAMDVIYYCTER